MGQPLALNNDSALAAPEFLGKEISGFMFAPAFNLTFPRA